MAQYDNLKDYFYGEYGTELKSAISSQILADGSNKNISDITIISLKCDDDIASNVTITLGIAANVVDDIESSMSDKQFFIVTMKGNLDIQFQDIRIIEIRSAEHDELPEDNILSHFILPDIPLEQVERIGNELYVYYKKHAKFTEPGLSLTKIIDNMCAPIFFSDLNGDCLGRVNFVNSDEKIYRYDTKEKILKYVNHSAEPGTILINKKRYYDELNGEVLITVAHELIHWQLHQKFFKLLVILGTTTDAMNCSATISVPDDNMTDVQKALCIAEWQANTLAMRLAIPQNTGESTIKKIASNPSTYRDNAGDRIQARVIEFAKIYNVSPLVAKERLRQLGCDYVDGTCLEYEENGKKIQAAPFCFQPGSLEDDETFIIYRDNFNQLLRENEEFAELIENRYYIYTEYVICINDAKYITPVSTDRELRFDLSDYAREHANECCLKLTMHTKQNATTYTPFDYLCKLEDGAYSHIHILTKEALNDLKSYKRRKKDKKEAEKILVQMDNANIVSFKDALRFHMSRLKIEPEDMPDELYLKETTFLSYYKANRNPSLKRAMIICNKLNLPYKLCIDLLKRARITLNTDKKEDELYDYLLTITNATLDDWELFLETNGFNPLIDKPCES